MEKVTIYKNKGETFRCHFKIDGAEIKDTVIRLCMEFQDHPNLFFYGELKEDGECLIEIPRLKNLDEKTARLTVEAIADSVYFRVYEADVDLRNSVEVSMQTPSIKKSHATKVQLEDIAQTERVVTPPPPEPEPVMEHPDHRVWGADKKEEPVEEPKSKLTKISAFKRYAEYANKRK